jgi:hypothetical protein
MTHTIEQYLMRLTGAVGSRAEPGFVMLPGDSVILTSISRQLARGIAMTDKQYLLVKSKLLEYRDQFEKNNMHDLDIALTNIAQPLRTIDRSQTVSVVDNKIVVKFPFNKKTIGLIETIASKYKQFYKHEKGTNVHEFKMYEPLIYDLIEEFSKKNFTIDSFLLETFEQIKAIKEEETKYVPYVTADGLVNVSQAAIDLASLEIGKFDQSNKIKYWDRAYRYGYRKTPAVFRSASQLAENIANRNEVKMYVNPTAHSIEDIANALCELDRFPLLVTLSRNKELEEMELLFSKLGCVAPSEQILLDRIEDKHNANYGINQFIKDKKFSTWLDKNIKVVYIFKNSLPKLLVKGEWRPVTHLTLNGERDQTVTAAYISEHCDLSVVYDSQRSYWNESMSRQLNQWV